MPKLQTSGGLCYFLRDYLGHPIPSPALFKPMHDRFTTAVEPFVTHHAIPVVRFDAGQDKDAMATAHRTRFRAREGVVMLGVAQEKMRAFKAHKRAGPGTKVTFDFSRQWVAVNQYYFYVQDRDWGPAFVKIGTYLPYPIKLCLNGHEWVKQQLRRQRLRSESLDNGFRSCPDPTGLQTVCDALGPADVQAFFDRWSHRLPWPVTPADRAAGYDHRLHAGFYAQDQWTIKRLALQGALRYERAWSHFPAGQGAGGPDTFHASPQVFPEVIGVPGFNDIVARGGGAYDLFGNGRTSLKVNIGKYLQAANNQDRHTVGKPANSFQQTTARNWVDGNRNYAPDCDLMNPAAQDNRVAGGDCCSQWLSPNFGSPQSVSEINPAILEGWGIRPSDWQFGASVQHEILPRMSVEAGYHRRWFQGFTVTDNRALGPSDYDLVNFTAPSDPRLPDGGGYPVQALAVNKIVASDNYVTFSSDYGDQYQYWQGVDVNLNARLRNGLVVQGGTSTGRGVRDNCEVVAKLPETLLSAGVNQQPASCHVVEPFQTQFRGLASYVIPKIDVQLSTGIQLKPGTGGLGGNDAASNGSSLNANYNLPNAQVLAILGRPIVGGGANLPVNLLVPGQKYGQRVNQVDLRAAKIIRIARTRSMVGVDLYNLFNANPGLTYNQAFGPNYLRPSSILMPRFVRFNVTVDF